MPDHFPGTRQCEDVHDSRIVIAADKAEHTQSDWAAFRPPHEMERCDSHDLISTRNHEDIQRALFVHLPPAQIPFPRAEDIRLLFKSRQPLPVRTKLLQALPGTYLRYLQSTTSRHNFLCSPCSAIE